MVYLGRIVGVGRSEEGKPFVVYGVSGRSEPSRQRKAVVYEDRVAIEPLGEMTQDQRRQADLLIYNAMKVFNGGPLTEFPFALVSNGKHTDPTFDRIIEGDVYPVGALSRTLKEFGPEPDSYHTPRIMAMNMFRDHYLFGIIKDAEPIEPKFAVFEDKNLASGEALTMSTYVGGTPEPQAPKFRPYTSNYEMVKRVPLHGETANELAESMFYSIDQDYVVCAASGVWLQDENRWRLAVRNKN